MLRRLTLAFTHYKPKAKAYPETYFFQYSGRDLGTRILYLNKSVSYTLTDKLFRRVTGENLRCPSLNHLTLDFTYWDLEADESIDVDRVPSTHSSRKDIG